MSSPEVAFEGFLRVLGEPVSAGDDRADPHAKNRLELAVGTAPLEDSAEVEPCPAGGHRVARDGRFDGLGLAMN